MQVMIHSWLVALVKMKQTKGELSGSLVPLTLFQECLNSLHEIQPQLELDFVSKVLC